VSFPSQQRLIMICFSISDPCPRQSAPDLIGVLVSYTAAM
jgi:hypothetical protein